VFAKPPGFRQILFPDIHTGPDVATILMAGQREKTGFRLANAT
jgi:hypothetical protein